MNKNNPQALSPAKLHILLALAGEEMHGYKIIKEVAQLSDGQYTLGPGTLYDNLQKLMDEGMVLDMGHRPGDEDTRRRYYKRSAQGRKAFAAEVTRLDSLVVEAKLRLRKPVRAR